MKIENKNILEEHLRSGVNLFLGAGFSTLAKDATGRPLPVGSALKIELATQFNLQDTENINLGQLCTILSAEHGNNLDLFLRERFTIATLPPAYEALLQINIRNIYSTNIDNLCEILFRSSKTHYLNNARIYGPRPADRTAVNYYPLHGSVSAPDDPILFTPTELASAFDNNINEWANLIDTFINHPVIFLGYSLEDPALLQALTAAKRKTKGDPNKIWVLSHQQDPSRRRYLTALGLSLIEGSTEDFLHYIKSIPAPQNASKQTNPSSTSSYHGFEDMLVPASNKVPVRRSTEFFTGAGPSWHDILFRKVPHLSHYSKALNLVGGNKNITLTGIPASGKTTLMMQLAVGIQNTYQGRPLFICITLTKERATLLSDRIGNTQAIILIDNYADSIDAILLLSARQNLRLVCFEQSYSHEMIKHKLPSTHWINHDISGLIDRDIQEIYKAIPEAVRAPRTRTNLVNATTPVSVFEVVEAHCTVRKIRERLKDRLDEIHNISEELHDLLVMFCYVHSCRTPVSMDMIFAFSGGYSSYQAALNMVKQLRDLVIEASDYLELADQDYFLPRSALFADAVLAQVLPSRLGRTLRTFHRRLRPEMIAEYRIFQRQAFDAKQMRRAFQNWQDGKAFYEECIARNSNPYIKQQAALYLDDFGRHEEAYIFIERAVRDARNRIWTINNTYAIIVFKTNIHREGPDVRPSLDESMEILNECYRKDARKPYHLVIFGRQAVQYIRRYKDERAQEYVRIAAERVDEMLNKSDSSWFRKDLGDLQRDLYDVSR